MDPNQTVTEFGMLIWNNWRKVLLLVVIMLAGPGLYADWSKKRAAEQFDVDRKSVDTEASIAGMMLLSAWKSCSKIGIVNDMEHCANYEGRLIQELSAPILAQNAIRQRDSYYKNCQRFYKHEDCWQLLQRSVSLSNAQGKSGDD